MPGRCCSSTRRRAHRGSLPSPCGSVPDEAGRSRRPCAPGLPEPTAGPPYGGRPHIPAALPHTRGRTQPSARVAAGLSRVAPHAPGGPPCHAPPVAFLGLRRARTIHIDRVPGLCPDSCYPRGAGPRSPRSLGDHPIFFRLSSLVETSSDDPGRTRRAPPRAVCHRGCPPPVDGLTSSSPTPKTLPHLSRALSTGLPTVVLYSVEIDVKHRRASPATGRYDTRTQLVGGVVHSHPQDSCGYSHPRNADDDGGPQGLVCRDKS